MTKKLIKIKVEVDNVGAISDLKELTKALEELLGYVSCNVKQHEILRATKEAMKRWGIDQ